MSTSVPAPYFGPLGFIGPPEPAILTGRQTDINTAFGGNLNPGLTTPQGQIASSDTAIIGDCYAVFTYFCNQVDPAFASGRMQDGIARIYFIYRDPALPTVVTATCYGLTGVVIPTGAIALAADGNLYTCTGGGTIPPSGSIDLQFACNLTGPIACPAGSLATIYQQVNGWDSITNGAPGVLGNVVEQRAPFEQRRQQSVAQNAVGPTTAILGSVLGVPGVLDAYVVDNPTAAPATIGGVTLGANATYVAVVGGATQAIANAIWKKKAPGSPWYAGNTTASVQDPNPLYSGAGPSYTVTWQTPAPLTAAFTVTLANNPGVPSNALALITAAITLAFAGADGGPRQRIGQLIFASRYYAGVAGLGTWVQIISIQVNTGGGLANDAAVTIAQVPALGTVSLVLV